MVRLPRNEKRTHRLNSRPQMWPSDLTLTLNFQGQIWNLLYLNQKWSDCHETKANISIWTLDLKFDNGFDLGHDLDIWIFKVICDLDHLVTKVRCKHLPDSDQGDFSCRRAVDSSSSLSMMGWKLINVSVTKMGEHSKNYVHSLCFVVFCCGLVWGEFYPLGQSCDCPSASESTLKNLIWVNQLHVSNKSSMIIKQPWNIRDAFPCIKILKRRRQILTVSIITGICRRFPCSNSEI